MALNFGNRFTERARKVLMLAQEQAKRMNHNYVGTEHLLLGLMQEESGVAVQVLRELSVNPYQVRKIIEDTVSGHRSMGQTTGLTPRTKRVIELAIEEARRMGHHYIGTEHLLLGLIREGEGLAVSVLRRLGVDLDALRMKLVGAMTERKVAWASLNCARCAKSLQAHWHYCPFCGALAPGRCPHCHHLLPDEEGVQFCPRCGSQV